MTTDVETFLELVKERKQVPVYVLMPGERIKIKMPYEELVVRFAALRDTVYFDIAGETPDLFEVHVYCVCDQSQGWWDGAQFVKLLPKNPHNDNRRSSEDSTSGPAIR